MRFLVALAVIAITVYSVIDCARAEDRQRRGLPAWLWVTVIILLPGVGGLVWLLVSRMTPQERPRGYSRPSGPVAPDDDPDFLAGLGRRTAPEAPQPPEAAPKAKDHHEQDEPDSDTDDGGTHPDQDGLGGGRPSREEDRGRRSPE